jgi:hypothetical protein
VGDLAPDLLSAVAFHHRRQHTVATALRDDVRFLKVGRSVSVC